MSFVNNEDSDCFIIEDISSDESETEDGELRRPNHVEEDVKGTVKNPDVTDAGAGKIILPKEMPDTGKHPDLPNEGDKIILPKETPDNAKPNSLRYVVLDGPNIAMK